MIERARLARALGLGTWLWACAAAAELPAEGEPIQTNSYAIDLYQGPVLASSRVTGLAGSFVAMAEGVDGDSQNPASPAVRTPYSRSHFDYDLGVSVTFPSTLAHTDFYNSGRQTVLPEGQQSGFVFLGIAVNLQLGRWGLGLTTDVQNYSLNRARAANVGINQDELFGQIVVGHAQLAHAFADGQLVIGIGERTTTLSVNNEAAQNENEREIFSTVGAGYEAGFVWRPNNQQYRIGAAFRSSVSTSVSDSSKVRVLYAGDPENELWLPDRIVLPWDLNVGMALQFGPRPLNPRWINPNELLLRVRRYLAWRARERVRRREFEVTQAKRQGRDAKAVAAALDTELSMEAALDEAYLERAEGDVDRELARRYQAMQRFHVLLSTSVLISGAVDDAVGVESFLERRVQRSGEHVSLSPRVALESEVVPRWVRMRLGTYLEPTRFSSNSDGARQHGTAGLDLKLFPWTVFGLFEDGSQWRVTGSVDAARDYFGWGIAIGIWH